VNNIFNGKGFWIFPNGTKKGGTWINGNRECWDDEEVNIIRAGQTIPQGT
jgi:hypothetical protein